MAGADFSFSFVDRATLRENSLRRLEAEISKLEKSLKVKILIAFLSEDRDKCAQLMPVLVDEGVLDLCDVETVENWLPAAICPDDYKVIVVLFSPAMVNSALENEVNNFRNTHPGQVVLCINWQGPAYQQSPLKNLQVTPGQYAVEEWPVKLYALRNVAKHINNWLIDDYFMDAWLIEKATYEIQLRNKLAKQPMGVSSEELLINNLKSDSYYIESLVKDKWFTKRQLNFNAADLQALVKIQFLLGSLASVFIVLIGWPHSDLLLASLVALPQLFALQPYYADFNKEHFRPFYFTKKKQKLNNQFRHFIRHLALPCLAMPVLTYTAIKCWKFAGGIRNGAWRMMVMETGIACGIILAAVFYLITRRYVPRALNKKLPAINDTIVTINRKNFTLYMPYLHANNLGIKAPAPAAYSEYKLSIRALVKLIVTGLLFAFIGWKAFTFVNPQLLFYKYQFSLGLFIMYGVEGLLVLLMNLWSVFIGHKYLTLKIGFKFKLRIFFSTLFNTGKWMQIVLAASFAVEFLISLFIKSGFHGPVFFVWLIAFIIPVVRRLPYLR